MSSAEHQPAAEPQSAQPAETSDAPNAREDLKAAIRRQIEYYFSRENLLHDGYLRSLMNPQNAVPVAKIVRFKRMTQICDDPELLSSLIPEAIEGSTVCANTPDGGIKPIVKSQRNIIIIRDVPASTTKQAIQEAFAAGGASKIQSLRADIGDTWFLTMESEDAAKEAFKAIMAKKITIDGTPIKARLKADNGVRSLLAQPPSTSPTSSGHSHQQQQQQFVFQQSVPYMPVSLMNGQPFPYPGQQRVYSPRQTGAPVRSVPVARSEQRQSQSKQSQSRSSSSTEKSSNTANTGRRRNNANPSDEDSTSPRENTRKKKNNKGKKEQDEEGKEKKDQASRPDLTASNFPPLGGDKPEGAAATESPATSTAVPSPKPADAEKEASEPPVENKRESTPQAPKPVTTTPSPNSAGTSALSEEAPSPRTFAGYAAALMKQTPSPREVDTPAAAQEPEQPKEKPQQPAKQEQPAVPPQAPPSQPQPKKEPVPPPEPAATPVSQTPPPAEHATQPSKPQQQKTRPEVKEASSPQPAPQADSDGPAWGGKRSFLDVVKN